MDDNETLPWEYHTANFWQGCHEVASGCDLCYAREQSARLNGKIDFWTEYGPRLWIENTFGMLRVLNKRCAETGEPEYVFINPLSDFFERDVGQPIVRRDGSPVFMCQGCDRMGDAKLLGAKYCQHCAGELERLTMTNLRKRAFKIIGECPHLRFLILTKRISIVSRLWRPREDESKAMFGVSSQFRRNVGIGVSVSDQQQADIRLPQLVAVMNLCALVFASVEPILAEVRLAPMPDWVIVGGEISSGGKSPPARPSKIDHMRSLVNQCRENNIRCFVNQLGSHVVGDWGPGVPPTRDTNGRWKLKSTKGQMMYEWPEDLRMQEMPKWPGP